MENDRWVVLKFGGTSVASFERWKTIKSIVEKRRKEGFRPLIVCSALPGISDELETGMSEKIIETISERHEKLAKELGVSFGDALPLIEELKRLVAGTSLVRGASPRAHAKVLSYGELLLTKLGAAYLNKQDIPTAWCDARLHLISKEIAHLSEKQSYLSAVCDIEKDEALKKYFDSEKTPVIIIQGFIAKNRDGETVLLGRGGSDVSAAYFAAKLGAERLEIWTDVPGMFTANPQKVPSARLLKFLDYDEAQEIASAGAKVLHPRTIAPVRRHKIPLHIYSTAHPDAFGTIIRHDAGDAGAQVKAISSRRGITLVSMETVDMWQQVGFLADIFACFKKHGLSVDLVSTSETNVTVTLDHSANLLDADRLKSLTAGLSEFCRVRVIESCAIVSLLGKNIRSILHHLTPALEVFDEQKIYLISQAANDLNLTFVVEEEEAIRLVSQLHGQLFKGRKNDKLLGPTWHELNIKEEEKAAARPWWQKKRAVLLKIAKDKTPLYVYDEETIEGAIQKLKSVKSVDKIFYAVKANSNPDVLKTIFKGGLGFECVSLGEVNHILKLFPKINRKRILFTPNFAPKMEYEKGLEAGVFVTLDNTYPITQWPGVFKNHEIFLRIDPEHGEGHHKYVRTAGSKSKFGIIASQLDEIAGILKKNGTRVIGLHAHVGSNILTADTWSDTALFLASIARRFPDVKIIDAGGGLGVPETASHRGLDIAAVQDNLKKFKDSHSKYKLWIEPGRFLIAEAGVILACVTQLKQKRDYNYVGVDTGMNTLIRPALYGSYHEIVNLSRLDDEATHLANIVGPICESGDILGHERHIVTPREGDILLIGNAGAYGRVMSSNYNMRPPAEEHFLKHTQP